jgi:serine/threonine protein kinase
MAPEQLRGATAADPRSDLWSIGVVLYELMTCRAPFDGATTADVCAAVLREEPAPLREIAPDVPAPLEAAVLRCLRKDPTERFADVAELAAAIVPFSGRTAEEARVVIDRLIHLGVRGAAERQPSAIRIPLRHSFDSGASIPPVAAPSSSDGAASHGERASRSAWRLLRWSPGIGITLMLALAAGWTLRAHTSAAEDHVDRALGSGLDVVSHYARPSAEPDSHDAAGAAAVIASASTAATPKPAPAHATRSPRPAVTRRPTVEPVYKVPLYGRD